MNLNLSSVLLVVACILMFLQGFNVPSGRLNLWAMSLAFIILWLLVA